MQSEFDQLRKTVDLGVTNVSGEVRQVGEKLTGFQSAMTDEFANFRSTVTEHLDVKLQMIDVKLSGSVISRFTTVETNILNRIDFCEISVNRRMDCSDGTIDKLNDKVNKLDNDIQKVDEHSALCWAGYLIENLEATKHMRNDLLEFRIIMLYKFMGVIIDNHTLIMVRKNTIF